MNEDAPKPKLGRPTKFNQELADFICEKIAINPISLERICAMYEEMPMAETIRIWKYKDPIFSAQYNRTLSERADTLAEDTLKIADDIQTYIDEKGVERVDSGVVRKANSKIEARRWLAAQTKPKTWGTMVKEMNTEDKSVLLEELLKDRAALEETKKKDY